MVNRTTASVAAAILVLVFGLVMSIPAVGHESISQQEIEEAVERVLEKREKKRRHWGLCKRLAEGFVQELGECARQEQKTPRCSEGSIMAELLTVLDRPECATYQKTHERCWENHPPFTHFSAHLYRACITDEP